jgi:hypothetical protein
VNCGHALANGSASRGTSPASKPPPPETASWLIERTPPEMLEEARRAFDESEYLAAVREVDETGGVKFEDLIGEIEEVVKRRD